MVCLYVVRVWSFVLRAVIGVMATWSLATENRSKGVRGVASYLSRSHILFHLFAATPFGQQGSMDAAMANIHITADPIPSVGHSWIVGSSQTYLR